MIGFIGFGNMGSAIFHKLSTTNLSTINLPSDLSSEKTSFYIYDVKPIKIDKKTNVFLTLNLKELFEKSTYIFLAVKPKDFAALAQQMKPLIHKRHILISVMAGITLSYLNKSTASVSTSGTKKPMWVRVMPNTPSLIGAGVGALSFSNQVEKKERSLLLSWFNELGYYYETEESQMDVVTATTGSGPAFVFTFVQALVDAGVKLGMPREQALKNIIQMVKGSCEFIAKSKKHPYQLRDEVSSPGGTTIEGLLCLSREGFEKSIHLALEKTFEKSVKITKQIDK